jgi:hypothetical protein
MNRRSWWGGVAMLIVCIAPVSVLAVGRSADLTFHLGDHFAWDMAGQLSVLPGVAAVALLAPFVGYRRRDALLMIIPVASIYVGWVIGARAAQPQPPHPESERWAGSKHATTTGLIMAAVAGVGYLTWGVVVSLMASP